MLGARLDGYRQDALRGLQLAVETKLANHHVLSQRVGGNLPIGGKDGYGKRQVEAAAFLLEVGRCHVHGDVGPGKLHAVILHGGGDAVAPLPDGDIAKAREMIHHSLYQADLYGHGGDLEAIDGGGIGFYKHRQINKGNKVRGGLVTSLIEGPSWMGRG